MGDRWFASIPSGMFIRNSEKEVLELQDALREVLSPIQLQLHELWITDKVNLELIELSKYVTLACASIELPVILLWNRLVVSKSYPYWTRYLLKDKFELYNATIYLTEDNKKLVARVLELESQIVATGLVPQ